MFHIIGVNVKRISILIILILKANACQAETLLNGSVVCWSEEILRNYIVVDAARKKHMEDHECLVWWKDMQAEVVRTKEVTVSNKSYFITNIILRYEYYGPRTDNVWTFNENIKKSEN